MFEACLSWARMSVARLFGAQLSRAQLSGAQFSKNPPDGTLVTNLVNKPLGDATWPPGGTTCIKPHCIGLSGPNDRICLGLIKKRVFET